MGNLEFAMHGEAYQLKLLYTLISVAVYSSLVRANQTILVRVQPLRQMNPGLMARIPTSLHKRLPRVSG